MPKEDLVLDGLVRPTRSLRCTRNRVEHLVLYCTRNATTFEETPPGAPPAHTRLEPPCPMASGRRGRRRRARTTRRHPLKDKMTPSRSANLLYTGRLYNTGTHSSFRAQRRPGHAVSHIRRYPASCERRRSTRSVKREATSVLRNGVCRQFCCGTVLAALHQSWLFVLSLPASVV